MARRGGTGEFDAHHLDDQPRAHRRACDRDRSAAATVFAIRMAATDQSFHRAGAVGLGHDGRAGACRRDGNRLCGQAMTAGAVDGLDVMPKYGAITAAAGQAVLPITAGPRVGAIGRGHLRLGAPGSRWVTCRTRALRSTGCDRGRPAGRGNGRGHRPDVAQARFAAADWP